VPRASLSESGVSTVILEISPRDVAANSDLHLFGGKWMGNAHENEAAMTQTKEVRVDEENLIVVVSCRS